MVFYMSGALPFMRPEPGRTQNCRRRTGCPFQCRKPKSQKNLPGNTNKRKTKAQQEKSAGNHDKGTKKGNTHKACSHKLRLEDRPQTGSKKHAKKPGRLKDPPSKKSYKQEQEMLSTQSSSPSSEGSGKNCQLSGSHQHKNNNKQNNPEQLCDITHNKKTP